MNELKSNKKIWTKEETIIAFYIYCIIPFKESSKNNPIIIKYANILGRTPSSLNMKIGNIGRLDPQLKERNISGLTHGAKMEKIVWDEFANDREKLVMEAEQILSQFTGSPIEEKYLSDNERNYTGKEKERIIKTRINQGFFRTSVLSSYDNRCAITGIRNKELLVASHIVPWSKDEKNRLNPHNGICLNSIHDKAFDIGLITVDKNYRIIVSKEIKDYYSNNFISDVFKKYEFHEIYIPKKFKPSPEFLEYHNDVIFRGAWNVSSSYI